MIRQRGYALLLGVFVLLGVGGILTGSNALQVHQPVKKETFALEASKAALLHYAANYIDHYGPQGAGLGHLPCPDTDAPDLKASDPWRLDGPNPPCARGVVQSGWLPRHVTVNNGRFHFHTRARQRLLYGVSSNYVNNPLGRPVNPVTQGLIQFGQSRDVVAILASPHLETDQHSIPDWFKQGNLKSANAAFAVIHSEDIRALILRRASDWLLRELNQALLDRCSGTKQYVNCVEWVKRLSQCELDIEYRFKFLLYANQQISSCDALPETLDKALIQIEAVPFKKHWFVRNLWLRFIDVKVDESCFSTPEDSCVFNLVSIEKNRIEFVLQSDSKNR